MSTHAEQRASSRMWRRDFNWTSDFDPPRRNLPAATQQHGGLMMLTPERSRPNLAHFGVPERDPGWIYAVRRGRDIKIGKTTDPERRLLREGQTWSPDPLERI